MLSISAAADNKDRMAGEGRIPSFDFYAEIPAFRKMPPLH
jgi:hypothetical protein